MCTRSTSKLIGNSCTCTSEFPVLLEYLERDGVCLRPYFLTHNTLGLTTLPDLGTLIILPEFSSDISRLYLI